MKSLKELMNISESYGIESSKNINKIDEDFTSWMRTALGKVMGLNDTEIEKVADAAAAEAKKQGVNTDAEPAATEPAATSTGPVDPPRPDNSTNPGATSSSEELEILDPQPSGYGMDLGKIIVKNGRRYYTVDVSKAVKRATTGEKVYRGSSLRGYTYDASDPQAPVATNADAVYFPVEDFKPASTSTAPTVDQTPPTQTNTDGVLQEPPITQHRGRNPNSKSAAPTVDQTPPTQPAKPATDTAPKIPGAETPGMPIDGDEAPTQPQPAFTDEPPSVDKTSPAAPPAAVKPPRRPGQDTSGLPAKLGQVTSANLMKDYQAAGKKPMDQVKTVQTALSRLGFDPGAIDGKYGNGVFKAVQNFQKANGLSVDGQVGPNTIKALIAKLSGPEEAPTQAPTQQNQSKDFSMKKAITESASMNVSMTADTADQVAELMKLLKNAGMPDAAPVSSTMAPMPSMPPMGSAAPKKDNMADFIGMVGGDEMDGPSEPCSVCGEVHEETSCSEDTSEYDAVVAEFDNNGGFDRASTTPKEEYKDHNYMTQDLSGGINRPKKAYAKAQDGDNAMAVEAIKSDLRKALEEALAKK
jgi:peptidoglycan hydrolase-like protein with peptidoglycan-binding domain